MGRDLPEDIRIEQETDVSGSSFRCVRIHPRDLPINILGDRPMRKCTGTQRHIAEKIVTPSPDRRRVVA
jgi:hypothetical protein